MTKATHDAATALLSNDILIKDYELKVPYVTDHFGRMWTRFNYFVGIESALNPRWPTASSLDEGL